MKACARKAALALGTGCLAGCGYSHWPNAHSFDSATASMSQFEIGVAEAAYRDLFDHNASGQQTGANFYCVRVTEPKSKKHASVPKVLIHDLNAVVSPVLNWDECTINKNGAVVSKSIPGPGLLFIISSIDCRSQSECVIDGGYHEGPESAAGYTLTFQYDRGKWVKKSGKQNWIS
jgi:hypothetical protein